MKMEELVAQLARDVRPVRPGTVPRRILTGLIGGGVASLLLVMPLIGLNPELGEVAEQRGFWVKWCYALALSCSAVAGLIVLARPENRQLHRPWLFAVPILALAGVALAEMTRAPSAAWRDMWLGQSWWQCPGLILLCAMPVYVGLLWSFRTLAPTRLRLAGGLAGLAAGAFGAMLYSLHCPEMSALFFLSWYSLGIAVAGALGVLMGPRLLRW